MLEIIFLSKGHFNVGGSFFSSWVILMSRINYCQGIILMSEGHFFVVGSF